MEKTEYLSIRNSIDFEISNWECLKYFFIDSLLICSLYFIHINISPWAKGFVSAPIVAIFMFRNFSMMHEAVHGASCRLPRGFNHAIGILCGAFCLLPFDPWKKIHLDHHFWSSNIHKDPSMSLITKYPKWPAALRKSCNFLWKMWFPVLSILQYGVFWYHSLGHLYKNRKNFLFVTSLMVPLSIWGGTLFLCSPQFIFMSLLPGVLLYLLMVEIVNFPHHLSLPKLQNDEKHKIWDQHLTARSCVYPKWLSKYIVLNFNFHIEHHLFPKAPWYRLEKIHFMSQKSLGSSYNSDPQFEWILKNRKKDIETVLRKGSHLDEAPRKSA